MIEHLIKIFVKIVIDISYLIYVYRKRSIVTKNMIILHPIDTWFDVRGNDTISSHVPLIITEFIALCPYDDIRCARRKQIIQGV